MREGWTTASIGDVAERIRRINNLGEDLPPLSVTKDRGVVLQSDKYKKRIATDPKKYLVARPGEFVYDAMSLYYGAIGRVELDSPGLVSPDYVLFRIDEDVLDPSFFQALVRSDRLHSQYTALAEGGNQQGKRRRIYWSVFESVQIPVPPLDEQRRIAAVLSSIGGAIARQLVVVEQTKALRQQLLEDALSEVRQSALIGEVLEGIDAGWSPLCEQRPARMGEWGVLKVSAATWGRFNPSENKKLPSDLRPRPEATVRSGDVIVSRANTPDLVGRSVVVREDHPRLMLSDKLLRLRPRTGIVDARYLNAALGSRDVREAITGAATGSSRSMKNISQNALKAIEVPLPSLAAQLQLADALDAVEEQEASDARVAERLRDTKHAIAAQLLGYSYDPASLE